MSSSRFAAIEAELDEPEPLFLGLTFIARVLALVVEVVEFCDKDRCGKRGWPSSSIAEDRSAGTD